MFENEETKFNIRIGDLESKVDDYKVRGGFLRIIESVAGEGQGDREIEDKFEEEEIGHEQLESVEL